MGWLDRFRERHPQLALKMAVSLNHARALATDPNTINCYFDLLETCLVENGLLNEVQAIYNCDETGLPLNPVSPKVITTKKSKHTSHICSGDKAQITVLACTCATGTALPPFVIYDRKSLNPAYSKGEVPGTLYGLSENGWMNQELFHQWFQNHFLQYVPPSRPLILLMDGHTSHYCPATIKLAAENKVVLFALPPNTTHLTQPLDRACFAPLKIAWREECHHFITTNPGKVVNRLEFSHLFAQAWYKAMTMKNVLSGFQVTGICPFDRSKAMPEPTPSPTSFKPGNLAERTGLAFIPLYSPKPRAGGSSSVQAKVVSPQLGSGANITPAYLRPKSSISPSHLSPEANVTPAQLCPEFESNITSSQLSPEVNVLVPQRYSTTISKHLVLPPPPCNIGSKREKSAGSVLTSKQNMMMLEAKQKKKAEKEQQQQERKQQQQKRKQQQLERKQQQLERKQQQLEMKQQQQAQEERKIINKSGKSTCRYIK